MSLVSKEKGSAAVEFILVTMPMAAIFVASVSITLYSYLRTVMLESTMEGARYAALADQDIGSGIRRTQSLLEGIFGSTLTFEVSGGEYSIEGAEVVRLQSNAKLLGDGFAGVGLLTVETVATREPTY